MLAGAVVIAALQLVGRDPSGLGQGDLDEVRAAVPELVAADCGCAVEVGQFLAITVRAEVAVATVDLTRGGVDERLVVSLRRADAAEADWELVEVAVSSR